MPMRNLHEVSAIIESLEKSNPSNAYNLIKTVEKESRCEFGANNVEFYSRPKLIQSLINIGNKYVSDEKILEHVVRILKTITERCPVEMQENKKVSEIHDPRTQGMYEFLFDLRDSTNKKIEMLIAYTIPFFFQFDAYEKKWEYIFAIPRIVPKQESMNRFRMIIEHNIGNIPSEVKNGIIDLVQNFLQSRDWHSDTHQQYTEMLKKLGP